jgi:hypothetical protein
VFNTKLIIFIVNTKINKKTKKMKKIFFSLTFMLASIFGYSQTCPTPTTSGVFITLDSSYLAGTVVQGYTDVGLCFYNNTSTDITAFQFRVYYDNAAFSEVDTITSLNTSFAQNLKYVDNPAGGYATITMTYTGSLSTFEIPNGAIVKLKLTHVTGFASLTSIDDMSFSTVTYPAIAAKQDGTDNALTLQSFGGVIEPQTMSYHGTFTNVTGSGAKNLTVALEKKLKPSGSWVQVTTDVTDNSGDFVFNDIPIDTTGYFVRLNIQGDTMSVGNVISAADAQKVQDYVLGTQTPTGFDYYHADVNGDNNLTISDVWGVFGRISGRFTQWPNSVKDVKFFSVAQYNTINNSSTNYTSTIAGSTNFTYDIVAGQPDSVTFYVLVPGDANGTGYNMARVTPIEVLVLPQPGVEHQIYNVIDTRVEYDFPTKSIEVNVPRLSVQEGNLVNIPVKVLTNGVELGSLQFGLKYDNNLLEFKGVETKSATSSWVSYLNTNDNQIDWGGFDVNNHSKPLRDGDEVVTLQFIAKQPQTTWETSPLWTTNKFAGNNQCKDMEITPANGIVQVYKMKMGGKLFGDDEMTISPNPTDDVTTITFKINEYGPVKLTIKDMLGKEYNVVVDGSIPEGKYTYLVDLGYLSPGVYVAHLVNTNSSIFQKVVIK